MLDPFGGTGTTAHVAHALGRTGISLELSEAYCKLAADRMLAARRAAKVQSRVNRERQLDLPRPTWRDRVTALMIPGLEAGTWQIRGRSDPAARALADRHYSRKTRGAPWIGPPGRVLVLVTPCERAVWLTHWPRADLALDGLDAWRCSIFRNEGAGLSSELIVAAMALTAERWSARPPDGWLTWIDPAIRRERT